MGSSSYITDKNGEIIQHTEYIAFGVTFVDEHSVSNKQPYLFNGKELDFETGLYYYGARYYDPKVSLWLNVDPLAEVQPNKTPYHYVHQNPINLIDPTGMEADHIIIRGEKENYHYDENDKYTGNDKFIKATLSAIDEIKKSSTGSDMINELDASDNIFYIQSGSTNSFKPTLESFADPSKATESTKKFNEQGKIGSGGVINWNEQDMRIPTTTSDLSSKEIILGHEMAHALDSNRGKLDRTLENGVKRSE